MNTFEKKQLINRIQTEIVGFNKDELIDYTKISLLNIYRFLCEEKIDKVSKYCSENLINKMITNKDDYRISKNIDTISVCHASIIEFENINNKVQLKVCASIFFYFYVSNNIDNTEMYDKYWNDIWIITYELNNIGKILNKCPCCGSFMEYNQLKHMFMCNYCRNNIYYSQIKWKITDIEVEKD